MSELDHEEPYRIAAKAIANAEAILIGAGAGMGVDSGLPDFRGDEGFWHAYPPFKKLGLSFYDLADPVWFHRNPHQAWGFYGHRQNLYRATSPHAGFEIIRHWCNDLFVFTSNVDGHFHASRFAPERIVECHGSIHYLQCSQPCSDEIWPADNVQVEVDETTFLAADPLPKCGRCGRVARPNILMFGDASWVPSRSSDQHHRFRQWQGQLEDRPLVGIEFGAGTAVPSVRREMQQQTRGRGSCLVRINPRESECPGGVSVAAGALEAIEKIDQILASA